MKMFRLTMTVCAALAVAESASAATLSIGEMFQRYGVISIGNFTMNKETEGRVFTYGTLNIPTSLQIGFNTTIPVSDFSVAAFGGVQGSGNVQINQGSVLYRNTASPTPNFNMNSGGTIQSGTTAWNNFESTIGWTQSTLLSSMQSVSSMLAGKVPDGVLNFTDPNQYHITGSGAALSVVNVTAAQLANAHGLNINPNGSGLLVINVTGSSVHIHANYLGGSIGAAQRIFWNFIDATSVTSVERIAGSSLSPFANVNLQKGSEGGVYVGGTLVNNDQIHFKTPLDVSAIPEPGVVGLLVIGGVSIFFRRRRSA